MTKFNTVAGLYVSKPFSDADYVRYTDTQMAIEDARKAIDDAKRAQQGQLQTIVAELILSVGKHPQYATPIVLENAFQSTDYDSSRPFTRALFDLRGLNAHTGAILSSRVMRQLLDNLCNAFKSNELPHGFDQNFQLHDQFAQIVQRARRLGAELEIEFSPIKNELKSLETALIPLEQKLAHCKRLHAEADPRETLGANLKTARDAAIQIILDKAQKVIKSEKEAPGIRGICNELLKKQCTSSGLDQIISSYPTLQNISRSGFAATQIAILKDILEKHELNIIKLQGEGFCDQVLRDAAIKKPIVATSASSTVPAHKPLIAILDEYLNRRSAVKDDKNRTRDYLHCRFFSCFQKSYSQKQQAVIALKSVLNGDTNVSLLPHLATLRNGQLGKTVRAFIKAGHANHIVSTPVNTVREFVRALQNRPVAPSTPSV